MFRSDKQRKAMFAAISGRNNMFSITTDKMIKDMKGFGSSKEFATPAFLTGDEQYDIAAVIAGTKPAAIVAVLNDDLVQRELIEEASDMGYSVHKRQGFDPVTNKYLGDEYIVGDSETVEKLKYLKDNVELPFDRDYHIKMGELLGYDKYAIDEYIDLTMDKKIPYAKYKKFGPFKND